MVSELPFLCFFWKHVKITRFQNGKKYRQSSLNDQLKT
jgi:hypothetical protein